ncbi:MAG: hypothetical protein QOI66_2578 [Myxococcales bacterium]|jgi:uncharacterized damage-inducible protein DinB|nr:hypothetical protein [Myxococcales bacterium]
MTNHLFRLTAAVLVVGALSVGARASAAPGGFQEDYLAQLGDVEKKLMSLEDAMPPAKMSWRPDKGVRSVSEVYLHVAFGNYGFLKSVGIDPPADAGVSADAAKWDTKTTDKAEIKKVMEKSFEHVRTSVKAIPDADLDQKIKLFGKFEMTKRAALIALIAHINEHLGQSIAYARTNKIAPPWSKKGS